MFAKSWTSTALYGGLLAIGLSYLTAHYFHLFVCPLSRLVGLEKLNRMGTQWNNQWTGQDFMGCNFLFLLVDALAARLFSKYPT
jgi:hypothetical protein